MRNIPALVVMIMAMVVSGPICMITQSLLAMVVCLAVMFGSLFALIVSNQ